MNRPTAESTESRTILSCSTSSTLTTIRYFFLYIPEFHSISVMSSLLFFPCLYPNCPLPVYFCRLVFPSLPLLRPFSFFITSAKRSKSVKSVCVCVDPAAFNGCSPHLSSCRIHPHSQTHRNTERGLDFQTQSPCKSIQCSKTLQRRSACRRLADRCIAGHAEKGGRGCDRRREYIRRNRHGQSTSPGSTRCSSRRLY